MRKIKRRYVLLSLFFIIYFLFNTYLLSHYGSSWDEPEHLQRGQVYLQYFLTGDGNSFNKNESRLSIYQNFQVEKKWMDFSFWVKNDSGHPPLNGMIASFFNRIFYQRLGLTGDIEGYHLFVLLASFFLAVFVFLWTSKIYGLFAGIVAFLSIALYPLFFSESHFNIKDPVEASFYTAALLFFYKGVTRRNWKWIIISSIFAGFALSTKFNVLFIVFTIFPWLIIYKFKEIRSFIFSFIFFPFISFGILYAGWPFLWQSPINNLLKIFSYYKEIGSTIAYQPQEYLIFGKVNTFAMQWILYTTPIIILVLFGFGIIYALALGFKEKDKTSLFILFWFLVPIARVSMPNTGIYGGVRQIMEFIPAMAILSGIGASYLAKIVSSIMYKVLSIKSIHRKNFILYTLYFILIAFFLPITLKLISIHPNENIYFNPLIGGLKGAKERNMIYWGNTYGNAYRQGVEWLNKNAEQNSKLARGVAYEDAIPGIWLRKDIRYSHDYQSGLERKGEYIVELSHDMPSWGYFYYLNYAKNMLNPVYEVNVDDVSILTIWKNDWRNTKEEFKQKEKVLKVNNIKREKNSISIDLEKDLFLTEINMLFFNSNCRFSKEGYFSTGDSLSKWTNHAGDLAEIAFYKNFNPRKEKDKLSYLFPGIKARFIKVILDGNNNCFNNIKEVNVKTI